MEQASKVFQNLIAAHRKAKLDFATAQAAGSHAYDFARIIGELQGTLLGAAINLGFRGNVRAADEAQIPLPGDLGRLAPHPRELDDTSQPERMPRGVYDVI